MNPLLRLCVSLWVVALVWLHLFADRFEKSWGFNALSKWPPAAKWTLAALAVATLIPPINAAVLGLLRPFARPWAAAFRGRPRLAQTLIPLAFLALFWLLRSNFLPFDSDALDWIEMAEEGKRFHFKEPLATYIFYLAHGALSQFGVDAPTTIALVVCLCGAVFVWALLRACALLAEGPDARAVLFALVATTGMMQLFFGHIETYGPLVAGMMIYSFLALRFLVTPSASVIPPAIAFSITCCVHLSAGLLFPSLLWLCLARGGAKAAFVNAGKMLLASAIPALAFLGLVFWLGYDGPPWGVQELGGWDKTLWVAFAGPPRNSSQYVFLSSGHLQFLFNEHVLISAVGLPLLALVFGLGRAAWQDARLPFLALMSAFFLAYTVFFNPDLGFLDWDLFAPAALPYTLLGGFLLVRGVRDPAQLRALGLSLTAVAIAHALPFILNNAAVGQAEKYFAIGRFYEVQAKLPQAAAHFEKGLTLDPQSWKAHLALGFVHADMGLFDKARAEWAKALGLNPDCREARDNLQKLDELERRSRRSPTH